MPELLREKCTACRADAPRVTDAEIAELKPQIPDWEFIEQNGIPQLKKLFTFKNFKEALAFANKIGELAESEGHHPAILVEWGKVTVWWWTHKIKGLHKNDLIMAAKTNQLY